MRTLVPSEAASLLLARDSHSRPLAGRTRDVARRPSWIFVRRQLASYEAGSAAAAHTCCRILEPVRLLAACAAAVPARPWAARRCVRRGPPARRAARSRRRGRAAGAGTASKSTPVRAGAPWSSGTAVFANGGERVGTASQAARATGGAVGGARAADGAAPRSGLGTCGAACSWPAAAAWRTTRDARAA
uniref:Uncharacterized protein n=1 Tax=Alexandrium monilatum TaxID=311494 RepID=A0A7S4RA78_9DINO